MVRPVRPGRPKKARPSTRGELETEARSLRSQLDDRRGRLEQQALRQAQRELEASREHYAQLYDFAPVGHLTLDRSGIIRALNLTAAEMLGRAREHLIGRPFQVMVTPRTRRRFLSHLSRLRGGQSYAVVELELNCAAGPLVVVQMVTSSRHTDRAHVVEYPATLMDITERRRAEARATTLANLGFSLNAATEPAAAAQAVVDTALELCGWDASALVLCKPGSNAATELVHMETVEGRRVAAPPAPPGDVPAGLARWAMESGPQLILRKSEDAPAPGPSGLAECFKPFLSLMIVPIRWEKQSLGALWIQSYGRKAYEPEDLDRLQALADHAAGALVRLLAREALQRLNERLEERVAARTAELEQYHERLEELVRQRTAELEAANEQLRDEVANRKGAEAALLRTAEELKRSNMDLEQFAYAASHDLQEPLRAVGGYVRLLEHRFPDKLDVKLHEYITGAVEGANRMEQLITDLLSFSRLNTQGREVVRASLDVPLNAALHNLQFRIRAAGARVTNDPLPEVPVDQSQMVQLFQNLIANAIKFHGEQPPEIHVGARPEDGQWVVWVRDNGIGLDPQYSERIFQVFQRLHTRNKYSGTGIGLAICKRIVERHSGRIWVESQPGHGATFYFSLPANATRLTLPT